MIAIEMILTGQEPIRTLKKELDRRLVQSICAPLTLGCLHAFKGAMTVRYLGLPQTPQIIFRPLSIS